MTEKDTYASVEKALKLSKVVTTILSGVAGTTSINKRAVALTLHQGQILASLVERTPATELQDADHPTYESCRLAKNAILEAIRTAFELEPTRAGASSKNHLAPSNPDAPAARIITPSNLDEMWGEQ